MVLKKAQPARLLAVNPGTSALRLFLLGRGTTWVGSGMNASFRIDEEQVVKRHAAIRYRRGRYRLKSFAGSRGTLVNDQPSFGYEALRHGDVVRFGPVAYRFIDPDAPIRRRNQRFGKTLVASTLLMVALAAHFTGWDKRLLAVADGLTHLGWQPPSNPAQQGDDEKIAQADKLSGRTRSFQPAPVQAISTAAAPSTAPLLSHSLQWIDQINRFRAMAGLPAIRENLELSEGMDAHAHYLMVNFADEVRGQGSLGNVAYKEDQSKKSYSAKGAAAAANSQIGWGCGAADSRGQIERWIAAPFHRFGMLNPSLQESGFGEATGDGCWVAALGLPPGPEAVGPYSAPVEFPPDLTTVSIAYLGGEFPNPLTSCPGYSVPGGLPITLQIGRLVEIDLGTHSLTENSHPVEECTFDAKTYRNPDTAGQEYGRWALRKNGAVIMVPHAPLKPGAHYRVSIVANNRTYSWSFAYGEQ